MLKNTTDFGSCNTSPVMVFSVCVNVPPLGDEPFVTTAFIKPGSLTDRWELCVIGRQYCIRTAATFHFKPDPPLVPLHLPPTSRHQPTPSWRITVILGLGHALISPPPPENNRCHYHLPPPPHQSNNQSTTQAAATPAPHYSKGLSPPIFSHFCERPPHFLTARVYPISHDQPTTNQTHKETHTHTSSFPVMNDRWPSHWQLGSWCHIITVSPFRQNYQITPVLKRPGRLTGQPTKETQISERRATQKSMWDFTDRVNLVLFCSLS